MTSETRFSSYILLTQNLFCSLLFHTRTEVCCLNLLPFSFSDINKPCTERCGVDTGNILRLRKLWWESFVPKQAANPSPLLRVQNGTALPLQSSGSLKFLIGRQLAPGKHCAAGGWFPTRLSLLPAVQQQQQLLPALWSGTMGQPLSLLSRSPLKQRFP